MGVHLQVWTVLRPFPTIINATHDKSPGKLSIACFMKPASVQGRTKRLAAKMYFAVKTFGPRWDNEGNVLAIDYSVYDDWSDA